jgi:hypothetical protein
MELHYFGEMKYQELPFRKHTISSSTSEEIPPAVAAAAASISVSRHHIFGNFSRS